MQNMTAAQLSQAIENARFAVSEAASRAMRETEPANIARFTQNAAAARSELQSLEAAQTKANAVQVKAAKVEAKPTKSRCPHYKAIRRFFAVAKSAGLNCDNKKGMRAAFSAMLGKTVTTRADLQAADYGRAIQNIENGLMWW